MIDINLLRTHKEEVQKALSKRGEAYPLDYILSLDEERRGLLSKINEARHRKKLISKKIEQAHKEGGEIGFLLKEAKEEDENIKEAEGRLKKIEEQLKEALLSLPNIPDETVPAGKGKDENIEVRRWGEIPKRHFLPKPHWQIAKELGIIDFQCAASMAGSRFALYKGAGAKLERALINFMLDIHTKESGYIEVLPPFLVKSECMVNTGQLPKFEEDLYACKGHDLYLVPTAEVPLTNIHKGQILNEEELPIYYTAYTPCFRAEAGSWGKDAKGLIRQHQFNKVELVKICSPKTSYEELEGLVRDAEKVLQRLNLPYRVVCLCGGELGFSSSKTYDIEVWMPAEGRYVEISSCSNCEDFQSRRAMIRYREKESKKVKFVHTLNGSGVAIGRTVAALLENFQTEDGKVLLPEALHPYMEASFIS